MSKNTRWSWWVVCSLYTFTLPVSAQQIFPLQPADAILWLQSGNSDEGHPALLDLSANGQKPIPLKNSELRSFVNFHPVADLPGMDRRAGLVIDNLAPLREVSVFIVYEDVLLQTEESLIYIESESAPELIVTDQRAFKVQGRSFLNFQPPPNSLPRILTYRTQLSGRHSSSKQNVYVGNHSRSAAYPNTAFNGKILELIIFDRFLSSEECLVVETQLALRYGLPLRRLPRSRYLAPDGRQLWTAPPESKFHHNIIGLGRENTWKLNQKQAQSILQPNLLMIGVGDKLYQNNTENPENLTDGFYLLVGDDDGALALSLPERGYPRLLVRKWRMERQAGFGAKDIEFRLSARQFLDLPPSDEQWWLCVDTSGEGTFQVQNVTFQSAKGEAPQQNPLFRKVTLMADHRNQQHFTLASAPGFFIHWNTVPGSCASEPMGEIIAKPVGGTPPYVITLTGPEDFRTEHIRVTRDLVHTWTRLNAGRYLIRARDDTGNLFIDTVFLEDRDGPLIALDPVVQQKTDEATYLNPGIDPLRVERLQWTLPDRSQSDQPVVRATASGRYLLEVDSAGCKSFWDGWLQTVPDKLFRSVNLYPNPTIDGRYQVEIRLQRSASVQIELYRDNGQLVTTRYLSGQHYYLVSGRAFDKGAYRLRLETEDSEQVVRTLLVN